MRQDIDKLTGDKSTYAEETVPADSAGHFKVRAECGASILSFRFDYYASDRDNDPASKLLVETDDNGTAVPLRLRIDDNDVKALRSESKFTNEASVFFYDDKGTRSALSRGVSSTFLPGGKFSQGDTKALGAIGDLSAMFGMIGIRARGAGTIGDFSGAKVIKIEVPLADGRKEVVPIAPHDAALQPFLESCASEGLTALPHPQSAEAQSACVVGAEVTAKAGAVVFSPDDLKKPLDREAEGADFIVQAPPDNLPPELCMVRLSQSHEDDPSGLYVISQTGLQSPDEYHAIDRDRTWTGTEDEFKAALQASASKYASMLGIQPEQFRDEFDYIGKLVHRCAAVTKPAYDGGLARLGPEYRECDTEIIDISTNVLHKPKTDSTRAIVVWPSLRNLSRGTGGFTIQVDVTPEAGAKHVHLSTLFHHYGIIEAEFPQPR